MKKEELIAELAQITDYKVLVNLINETSENFNFEHLPPKLNVYFTGSDSDVSSGDDNDDIEVDNDENTPLINENEAKSNAYSILQQQAKVRICELFLQNAIATINGFTSSVPTNASSSTANDVESLLQRIISATNNNILSFLKTDGEKLDPNAGPFLALLKNNAVTLDTIQCNQLRGAALNTIVPKIQQYATSFITAMDINASPNDVKLIPALSILSKYKANDNKTKVSNALLKVQEILAGPQQAALNNLILAITNGVLAHSHQSLKSMMMAVQSIADNQLKTINNTIAATLKAFVNNLQPKAGSSENHEEIIQAIINTKGKTNGLIALLTKYKDRNIFPSTGSLKDIVNFLTDPKNIKEAGIILGGNNCAKEMVDIASLKYLRKEWFGQDVFDFGTEDSLKGYIAASTQDNVLQLMITEYNKNPTNFPSTLRKVFPSTKDCTLEKLKKLLPDAKKMVEDIRGYALVKTIQMALGKSKNERILSNIAAVADNAVRGPLVNFAKLLFPSSQMPLPDLHDSAICPDNYTQSLQEVASKALFEILKGKINNKINQFNASQLPDAALVAAFIVIVSTVAPNLENNIRKALSANAQALGIIEADSKTALMKKAVVSDEDAKDIFKNVQIKLFEWLKNAIKIEIAKYDGVTHQGLLAKLVRPDAPSSDSAAFSNYVKDVFENIKGIDSTNAVLHNALDCVFKLESTDRLSEVFLEAKKSAQAMAGGLLMDKIKAGFAGLTENDQTQIQLLIAVTTVTDKNGLLALLQNNSYKTVIEEKCKFDLNDTFAFTSSEIDVAAIQGTAREALNKIATTALTTSIGDYALPGVDTLTADNKVTELANQDAIAWLAKLIKAGDSANIQALLNEACKDDKLKGYIQETPIIKALTNDSQPNNGSIIIDPAVIKQAATDKFKQVTDKILKGFISQLIPKNAVLLRSFISLDNDAIRNYLKDRGAAFGLADTHWHNALKSAADIKALISDGVVNTIRQSVAEQVVIAAVTDLSSGKSKEYLESLAEILKLYKDAQPNTASSSSADLSADVVRSALQDLGEKLGIGDIAKVLADKKSSAEYILTNAACHSICKQTKNGFKVRVASELNQELAAVKLEKLLEKTDDDYLLFDAYAGFVGKKDHTSLLSLTKQLGLEAIADNIESGDSEIVSVCAETAAERLAHCVQQYFINRIKLYRVDSISVDDLKLLQNLQNFTTANAVATNKKQAFDELADFVEQDLKTKFAKENLPVILPVEKITTGINYQLRSKIATIAQHNIYKQRAKNLRVTDPAYKNTAEQDLVVRLQGGELSVTQFKAIISKLADSKHIHAGSIEKDKVAIEEQGHSKFKANIPPQEGQKQSKFGSLSYEPYQDQNNRPILDKEGRQQIKLSINNASMTIEEIFSGIANTYRVICLVGFDKDAANMTEEQFINSTGLTVTEDMILSVGAGITKAKARDLLEKALEQVGFAVKPNAEDADVSVSMPMLGGG